MARILTLLGTTMGLSALVSFGLAQSLPPDTTAKRPGGAGQDVPAAQSPVFAPAPSEKAPAPPSSKRRAISPEVAAALAAASPKYTPPPPQQQVIEAPQAQRQTENEDIDLRDVDKPKNQIIRLPKMVVMEAKPVIFSERAIHTQKGLTEIAMRRYMSEADRALNRFTLPLFGTSMQARAMAMYQEDERLRNMTDLEANAQDAAKSDPAAGAYIRREAQQTYIRESDFGWTRK